MGPGETATTTGAFRSAHSVVVVSLGRQFEVLLQSDVCQAALMLRPANDYAPYVTIAWLWISACVAKAVWFRLGDWRTFGRLMTSVGVLILCVAVFFAAETLL
jgi:hypothetical protein